MKSQSQTTPVPDAGANLPERAEAAVAIVHAAGPEESVLLMRRTSRDGDPWSGHWSFPGGRREEGDRDLLDTALRELYEECGVRLERNQLEARLAVKHAGQHNGRLVLVAPFLFRLDACCPIVPDPEEAAECLWLPLSEVRDAARHLANAVPGLPGGRQVSGIPLNGEPLWGFTYRVLCDWLGVAMPDGM